MNLRAVFLDLRNCDYHDVNTTVVMVIVMVAGRIPSDGIGGWEGQGTNVWEKDMKEANYTINTASIQLP